MEWKIKRFDEVQSTNESAKLMPAGSVVIAESQTGGRGRYGRVWVSPKGNLYLSAVVPEQGGRTPVLAVVAGVAVIEALSDFPALLKWPNDVLINGGKVAGILLEKTERGTVVIGIGINVLSNPTEKMMYKTESLNGKISLNQLEENLLHALSVNVDLLIQNRFDLIREKWIKKAVGLGEMIEVHLTNKTIRGYFKEFSPQGELILETPDKIVHKITAGDVFLI